MMQCRKNSPKLYYAFVNKAKKVRSKIGPLKNEKNETVTDPVEQVQLLNAQYASVFTLEEEVEFDDDGDYIDDGDDNDDDDGGDGIGDDDDSDDDNDDDDEDGADDDDDGANDDDDDDDSAHWPFYICNLPGMPFPAPQCTSYLQL